MVGKGCGMVGRGPGSLVSFTGKGGDIGGGEASNPAGCPDNTGADGGRVCTGVIIGTGSGRLVFMVVGVLGHGSGVVRAWLGTGKVDSLGCLGIR